MAVGRNGRGTEGHADIFVLLLCDAVFFLLVVWCGVGGDGSMLAGVRAAPQRDNDVTAFHANVRIMCASGDAFN